MVTGDGVTAGEMDPEATGAMAAGVMALASAFPEVGPILAGRTVAPGNPIAQFFGPEAGIGESGAHPARD